MVENSKAIQLTVSTTAIGEQTIRTIQTDAIQLIPKRPKCHCPKESIFFSLSSFPLSPRLDFDFCSPFALDVRLQTFSEIRRTIKIDKIKLKWEKLNRWHRWLWHFTFVFLFLSIRTDNFPLFYVLFLSMSISSIKSKLSIASWDWQLNSRFVCLCCFSFLLVRFCSEIAIQAKTRKFSVGSDFMMKSFWICVSLTGYDFAFRHAQIFPFHLHS